MMMDNNDIGYLRKGFIDRSVKRVSITSRQLCQPANKQIQWTKETTYLYDYKICTVTVSVLTPEHYFVTLLGNKNIQYGLKLTVLKVNQFRKTLSHNKSVSSLLNRKVLESILTV